MGSSKPMDTEEALARTRAVNFAEFYTKYDARRKGPSPEEQGANEARELVTRWREAKAAFDKSP